MVTSRFMISIKKFYCSIVTIEDKFSSKNLSEACKTSETPEASLKYTGHFMLHYSLMTSFSFTKRLTTAVSCIVSSTKGYSYRISFIKTMFPK